MNVIPGFDETKDDVLKAWRLYLGNQILKRDLIEILEELKNEWDNYDD